MRVFRWFLGGCLLAVAAASWGQERGIPQDAPRGRMSHLSEMSVLLDGSPTVLSPGAIIRNQRNLIIVPSALPPSSDVRYTRDAQGQISRVWVLTDDEKRNAPETGSAGRAFIVR